MQDGVCGGEIIVAIVKGDDDRGRLNWLELGACGGSCRPDRPNQMGKLRELRSGTLLRVCAPDNVQRRVLRVKWGGGGLVLSLPVWRRWVRQMAGEHDTSRQGTVVLCDTRVLVVDVACWKVGRISGKACP
jgi:hypothetical protein